MMGDFVYLDPCNNRFVGKFTKLASVPIKQSTKRAKATIYSFVETNHAYFWLYTWHRLALTILLYDYCTAHVKYFTKAVIEQVKVEAFLFDESHIDSKI